MDQKSTLGESKEHIRGAYTNWMKVTSGVLLGSAVRPLLFLIYYMTVVELNSYLSMFTYDAKLYDMGKEQPGVWDLATRP